MRIAGSGVAGAGDVEGAGLGVDLGVEAGREAQVAGVLVVVVRHAVQKAGGAGEDRVGAVALGGVGAQGDAELAHQAGRADVVALDVADDEGQAAVGQRDHVVPVAADLEAAAGGDVAGGDAHAGYLGAQLGEHGALEAVGELAGGFRGLGSGEGLGEHAGDGGQDRAFVGGEGHRVGEGGHPGAHRAAGDRERQERPGLAAEVGGERPGDGVAVPVALGGGEVDRSAGADHFRRRVVRRQGHVGEGALVAGLLAVVADDLQTVALDAEDGQAVGGEAGHGQAGGDAQDLFRRAGLGQGAAGVQQERLAGAAPVAGDGGAAAGGGGGR